MLAYSLRSPHGNTKAIEWVRALKYIKFLLVAKLAYDILQKENPKALAGAEKILSVLAGQTITSSEDKYPFVECASFADEVKYKGGGW